MAAHCMPSGGGSRLISRPTLGSQTPKLAAGVPLMRHFRPGPLFIASEEILNKKKNKHKVAAAGGRSLCDSVITGSTVPG